MSGVEEDFLRAIQLDPDDIYSYRGYVYFLLTSNRVHEAKQLLSRSSHPSSVNKLYLPVIHALENKREDAIQSLMNISSDQTRAVIGSYVYGILGDTDQTNVNIELFLSKYNTWDRCHYLFLINCPFYDKIRHDSKFKTLLQIEKEKYEENLTKYPDINL
jgi:hypothetical protein